MKIDIDGLSYEELVALNHKVVERLRFLDSMNAHKEMMRFNIGDQVSFNPPGREKQVGTIAKYNKKTVTVISTSGQRWNISPQFLTQVKKAKPEKKGKEKVIPIKGKKR